MSEILLRITSGEKGIYEAVNMDCPQDDPRRGLKPDGSWLPKVGEDFPGAVSFWKVFGYKKYKQSRLFAWHCSVVNEQTKLLIASRPKEVLYEDDFQVIIDPSSLENIRTYPFAFKGDSKCFKELVDNRPDFIRHTNFVHDHCSYSWYSGSEEGFALGASVGESLGLKNIGIHHEVIRPGVRTSWPHAHSVEEEIAFILKGTPDIWINGKVYRGTPGETFYFPPGSNLAHTIMNNTGSDCEVLVLGEQDAKGDLIYYPMHPKRNEECKEGGYFWEDRPELSLGDHGGLPNKETNPESGRYEYQVALGDVPEKEMGEKVSEAKIYFQDKDIARHLGLKRVALHHQVLPTGYRTSLPHCESLEDEFLYVLKGSPIVWVNGKRVALNEGDCVSFACGTGVAHCVINDSGEPVELIVAGDMTKSDNQCAFPLNLELKDEMKNFWWEQYPRHIMEQDSPLP